MTRHNKHNKLSRYSYGNKFMIQVAVLLITTAFSVYGFTDIYSTVDAEGNKVFTDRKPSPEAYSEQASGNANYYSPTTITKSNKPASATTEKELSTINALASSDTQQPSTAADSEQSCQEIYARSCDEVNNWRQYALEQCGSDERCEDEAFLERKYKPITLAQSQAIARRAAINNNREEQEIAEFLKRKYSNYCNNQAALSCKNNNSCQQSLIAVCQDQRSLEQILRQYKNLSFIEKQRVIQQAKALATANGTDQQSYQKMLGDLLSLLVSQTLMGL